MNSSTSTLLLTGLLLCAVHGGVGAKNSSAASAADGDDTSACTPLPSNTVAIRAGLYRPFFKTPNNGQERGAAPAFIPVKAFRLDAAPVTRAEYLSFVCRHPEWRKSKVRALFAEAAYLADWTADLDPGLDRMQDPATHVSWFAARAYCAARNARLPTVAEWERVAGAEPSERIVEDRRTSAGGAPFRFAMGRPAADLRDTAIVVGELWEWNADFNSALASGSAGTASALFCGDGYRSADAGDYGGFLRHAFRSSLRANYTLRNLGFRCVQEESP